MEKSSSTIPETDEKFNMTTYKSITWKVQTGCGKLYITILFNEDGSLHKVLIPRTSKFQCSVTMRDGLARQATFQGRRDLKQLVKDLRCDEKHACDGFNVSVKSAIKNGEMGAYSCADAVAKVIEKAFKNAVSK